MPSRGTRVPSRLGDLPYCTRAARRRWPGTRLTALRKPEKGVVPCAGRITVPLGPKCPMFPPCVGPAQHTPKGTYLSASVPNAISIRALLIQSKCEQVLLWTRHSLWKDPCNRGRLTASRGALRAPMEAVSRPLLHGSFHKLCRLFVHICLIFLQKRPCVYRVNLLF